MVDRVRIVPGIVAVDQHRGPVLAVGVPAKDGEVGEDVEEPLSSLRIPDLLGKVPVDGFNVIRISCNRRGEL